MAVLETFAPSYGKGVTVTPGVASATTTVGEGSKSLTLTNTGSNICYVRVGSSGITASTADYPVLAGTQVSISKAQDHTTLAHISADGTTLHVIPGEGW